MSDETSRLESEAVDDPETMEDLESVRDSGPLIASGNVAPSTLVPETPDLDDVVPSQGTLAINI